MTVNSDITLTLSCSQRERSYTVYVRTSGDGIYINKDGTPGTSFSYSANGDTSIQVYGNAAYVASQGHSVARYPDSTPNMYGFDS